MEQVSIFGLGNRQYQRRCRVFREFSSITEHLLRDTGLPEAVVTALQMERTYKFRILQRVGFNPLDISIFHPRMEGNTISPEHVVSSYSLQFLASKNSVEVFRRCPHYFHVVMPSFIFHHLVPEVSFIEAKGRYNRKWDRFPDAFASRYL